MAPITKAEASFLNRSRYWFEVHVDEYAQYSGARFIVNATNDKDEIKKLLSVGFEYICEKEDILYFRKRK